MYNGCGEVIMNIKECIEKMTSEELEKLKQKYNAEDIDDIVNNIIINTSEKAIFLTDDEIKILAYFDDNEVSDYLLDNDYILKVNGKYIVYDRIKKLANFFIDSNYLNRKYFTVMFYVTINGKISFKDVMRLCRKSGVAISFKELDEIINIHDLDVDDNFIYDELTEDLPTSVSKEYKAFDLHMIYIFNYLFLNYYPNKIMHIIGKYMHTDEKENDCRAFCAFSMNGDKVFTDLDEILKSFNIKLPYKVKCELIELLTQMHDYLPNYIYKGNPPIIEEGKMSEEEYYDYIKKISIKYVDKNIVNYIKAYVCINGILDIDKLIEILEKNHNIHVSKEDIKIFAKYSDLHHTNNTLSLLPIDSVTSLFEILKTKNINYKIIDNPVKVIESFKDGVKQIESIIKKHIDDEKAISTFVVCALIGFVDMKNIKKFLDVSDAHLSENEIKSIISDVCKITDNLPCWLYNGFTKKEKANN